jgi:pSer/pThr/pTyr-binding forkhead associated (FHA) protein
MKFWLHQIFPPDEPREVLVDHYPFILGRRVDSDFTLPLAFISRHHCKLTLQGDGVAVQDLESHNGTFVNGRLALTPLPLQHGDELSLGTVAFRVVMPSVAQDTESRAGMTH